jgi:hypothetical protein
MEEELIYVFCSLLLINQGKLLNAQYISNILLCWCPRKYQGENMHLHSFLCYLCSIPHLTIVRASALIPITSGNQQFYILYLVSLISSFTNTTKNLSQTKYLYWFILN